MNNKILSLYEGFFLGGARILHTEVINYLQTYSSTQYHTVLGLTDRVVRESTLQQASETLPYQRLQENAVPIVAFPRDGSHPLTAEQTVQIQKIINNNDIIFSLKEQPLKYLTEIEYSHPLYVGLHRSDPETQGIGAVILRELSENNKLTKGICCSVSSKQGYLNFGVKEEHLTVVPNGISLERFHYNNILREQTRSLLGIHTDDPVILLVCRFDPLKGIDYFLDISVKYLDKHPNAHFLLCGTGMTLDNPEYIDLFNTHVPQAAQHAYQALGPQTEVNALYNAADLITVTSTVEAGPLVLLEGMAAGAVPVTTDVGDAKTIVRNDDLIFPYDDPQTAAQIWEQAYKHKLEHQNQILTFRDELSDKKMFQQYERILNSVKPRKRK